MYYRDLRSAAENDITSRNFCALFDVASMLYEEEERDKRIFQLFPRKTRTSVKNGVTRRNPQRHHQNLNGASSTSSSRKAFLLLDLNLIPPDDGSFMVYPRTPNSSSSLHLPDLHSIPADSKSADTTDPRNLNSQSWRKRRALEEKKPCGKFKKAKVETFSWIGRETPESLVQLMNDVNETVIKWGERTDLRLIFQRKLVKTDVNPNEGCLSMPFIRNDFLTPVELSTINNDKKTGIGAILCDQRNVKWGVMLKRWETRSYVLTCGWNDIVESNGLKVGDDISIWSFRWGALLCFALVTPPPSMAHSSSSLALCL